MPCNFYLMPISPVTRKRFYSLFLKKELLNIYFLTAYLLEKITIDFTPYKKSSGVQPELFMLYQTEVCRAQKASLLTAHKVARRLKGKTPDKKKYEATVKEITTNPALKSKIKRLIVEMVEDGSLSYGEYAKLFADDSEHYIGTKSNAWKYISYFSSNTDWTPHETPDSDTILPSNLQYVAKQIFEQYIGEKGDGRFKKEVLDMFALGKIGTPWLRRRFLGVCTLTWKKTKNLFKPLKNPPKRA